MFDWVLNTPLYYLFNKATTINISKTTITPLANAKIYNIDKKNTKCQNKRPTGLRQNIGNLLHKRPTKNGYLQLEYMSKTNRKTNTTTFQMTSVSKRKSHTFEFLDFIQNDLLK